MSALQLVNGHVGPPDSWPRLDPDALYGVIGDAVRSVAPHTEADPAAILMSLLCASGISIGPGPRIHAGLEPQPARLQVWIVGDSALGRKGSSWGAARTVMEYADEELLTSRVLSGFGSGEALVDAAADPDARDCRLLILAREGGQLLSIIQRKGDTTSTVLRESYDTDTLAVRSRVKTSVAKLTHIGLIAHITPADLVNGMSDTQIRNGFANRGLFCMSRRSKLLPRGAPAPVEVNRAGRCLGDAIRKARGLLAASFDETTGYAWDLAYESFGSDAPSPTLRDMEARGDMHCLRIAMLFAILDGTAIIGRPHLNAALAVWAYCRDSARHLFGPNGSVEESREMTTQQRDAKKFEDDLSSLDEALRLAGQLSGTDQRSVFSGNRTSAYVGRLRKELISRGQAVEQVEPPSVGRPKRLLVAVER